VRGVEVRKGWAAREPGSREVRSCKLKDQRIRKDRSAGVLGFKMEI
jgi:hypothetical protein